MLRHALLFVVIVSLLAGCNKAGLSAAGDDKKTAGSEKALLISPEDLVTLHIDDVASGPVITGTVQPERRADLRAEVSAVVLQILKDNGEPVKRDELLVRLDQTSIRDTLTSADATARSSAQALEQAGRQLERLQTLRLSGMTSTQALEDAEIRRNNLQSDLISAKARAAQARQQLQRTEVRAPFDGVVSDRRASVGDTAQIGKELLKVVDPASMRFEGLVSADRISSVRVGQAVRFRVNGYNQQEYAGVVKRVAPSANPTTRQVEVLVSFVGDVRPGVSGLYAEGQIAADSSKLLMLPDAALVRNGDSAYAWRVKGALLQKVALTIGVRDPRRGDYPVVAGLADGDKVVRNPLITFKDGQSVELAAAVKTRTEK
ncbi:membrane fusion protein (multidrug efflux system) [Actimicrobium sp. GrIS 1.19]|uniref:efflux RND transporter periplasmic adaptor subunit n=1 Tax=Actimicrobium sp. GrIS 1.19 TaxID=3071708 RepID=UPI002E03B3C3|nr:membrane fusion protein (multidrug efflux system) [Actimicrobium sp. GrIS 1.19]